MMKPPTDEDLAMRDPALAATMGALPANFGSDDFGAEYYGYAGPAMGYEFGEDEYGAEYYGYSGLGYEFGQDGFCVDENGYILTEEDIDDEMGYEFGDDEFGDEFGALSLSASGKASGGLRMPGFQFAAPRPIAAAVPISAAAPSAAYGRMPALRAAPKRPVAAAPTALAPRPLPAAPGIMKVKGPTSMAAPNQMALWNAFQSQRLATQNRQGLIEPNRDSSVKVERYVFPLSQAITLGTAVALALQGQPDTTIRPKRLTMNAPAPMFATITDIKIANVSVSVGAGIQDAFDYNAQGVGQSLDLPTISPANRVTISGNYLGFVPPGYTNGTAVTFTAAFKGPATIVA